MDSFAPNHPMRLPATILVALLVIGLAQLAWAYPQLPEIVASHFDGGGRPNGWMRKSTFVLLNVGMLAFLTLCFVGLPRWLARIPARWISLPNRDYWLAPERREGTLRYIQRQMLWFACAMIAYMLVITELVIRVNLGVYPTLPSLAMWLLLAGFLIFTLIWVLCLTWRLRRPRGA